LNAASFRSSLERYMAIASVSAAFVSSWTLD